MYFSYLVVLLGRNNYSNGLLLISYFIFGARFFQTGSVLRGRARVKTWKKGKWFVRRRGRATLPN